MNTMKTDSIPLLGGSSTTLTDSPKDIQNIKEGDWDGRIINTAESCARYAQNLFPIIKQNMPDLRAAATTAASVAGGYIKAAQAYTSNALPADTHDSSSGGTDFRNN